MEIIVAPVVSHAFVVPSRFDVQHHEIDIKIRQGATPGGMLHTGALVWVGSRLMGEWLATGYGLIPEIAGVSDEMQSTQQHPLAGKSVLELGCGVSAIPSLVAHYCGAKTVVSADLPDECDLLKINVQSCTRSAPEPAEAVDAPRVLCACGVSRTPSPLSCALCRREMFIRPFDWSKDDVKVVLEPVERYDYVLAAETLYEGTWEPQSRLIYTMLRPADAESVPLARCVLMVNTHRKAVHLFHRWLSTKSICFEKFQLPGADASIVAWRLTWDRKP